MQAAATGECGKIKYFFWDLAQFLWHSQLLQVFNSKIKVTFLTHNNKLERLKCLQTVLMEAAQFLYHFITFWPCLCGTNPNWHWFRSSDILQAVKGYSLKKLPYLGIIYFNLIWQLFILKCRSKIGVRYYYQTVDLVWILILHKYHLSHFCS